MKIPGRKHRVTRSRGTERKHTHTHTHIYTHTHTHTKHSNQGFRRVTFILRKRYPIIYSFVMLFSFTIHHGNQSKSIGKDLIQIHHFNDCVLFHVVDIL